MNICFAITAMNIFIIIPKRMGQADGMGSRLHWSRGKAEAN